MSHVTENFSLEEFACKDGTAYPIGALEADGKTWLQSRLLPLCLTLETIRTAANARAGKPGSIRVTSGFRTPLYNRGLGSHDTSQHPKGRAADIQHSTLTADQLHALILELYENGKLPYLGGLGKYVSFCHVDVRNRGEDNHLARWNGSRVQSG